MRKIDNVEKGLVEVIKYGAKMLSDPDPTHKRRRRKGDMTGLKIYANALHNIYQAMDGHRLYGTFGFKLSGIDSIDCEFKTVPKYETWKYQPQQMDWINEETESHLAKYEIDDYLKFILDNHIDKELC